jgi:hypothetical protein
MPARAPKPRPAPPATVRYAEKDDPRALDLVALLLAQLLFGPPKK